MKKLIIVCEEKLRKYADFLAQLISSTDDADGKIIGVQDGAVVAQVWTEADYSDQAIQISSAQYLLFIGNSKLIKDKRSHMVNMFSQYGMNYSWLGKQAVLYVDEIVDLEHYDDFIAFAKGNQANVEKLLDVRSNSVVESAEATSQEENCIKKLMIPLKEVQAAIVNASVRGLNEMSRLANNRKIEDQEYTCLILAFYMNGLGCFLGLSEE